MHMTMKKVTIDEAAKVKTNTVGINGFMLICPPYKGATGSEG